MAAGCAGAPAAPALVDSPANGWRSGAGGAAAAVEPPGAGRPASRSLTRLMTICGSNGLTSTPSHPTARARASSIGSKAPVRSSTGMCASAGSPLMNAATS